MFRNYFKTTFRNLWKNKGYSFLNIFGLAIGIACAALIFLWVEDELNCWLQGYEYRITISWSIFLFAGLLALFIALLTVSFQAIRAAVANPVESLRSEEFLTIGSSESNQSPRGFFSNSKNNS